MIDVPNLLELLFVPNRIVGRDFICRDNVRGRIVMVYEKGFEGNHHGIAEIVITSVVLNNLGEYFNGFDDTRYVLHLECF